MLKIAVHQEQTMFLISLSCIDENQEHTWPCLHTDALIKLACVCVFQEQIEF